MAPTSIIFLSMGILLLMDPGVSGNRNHDLYCYHCDVSRDKDCYDLKDKTNMSMYCKDLFDEELSQFEEDEPKTIISMTFEEDWKINKNRSLEEWKKNTKWVCVKQDIYVASKLPPGVTGEKETDSWEYGNSVDYEKPSHVARFCGLVGSDALKNHRESIDKLGGKFAIRISYCEKNLCNRGLKFGPAIGIILVLSKLVSAAIFGTNH